MTPAQLIVQQLCATLGIPPAKGEIVLHLDGEGRFQSADQRVCGIREPKPLRSTEFIGGGCMKVCR